MEKFTGRQNSGKQTQIPQITSNINSSSLNLSSNVSPLKRVSVPSPLPYQDERTQQLINQSRKVLNRDILQANTEDNPGQRQIRHLVEQNTELTEQIKSYAMQTNALLQVNDKLQSKIVAAQLDKEQNQSLNIKVNQQLSQLQSAEQNNIQLKLQCQNLQKQIINLENELKNIKQQSVESNQNRTIEQKQLQNVIDQLQSQLQAANHQMKMQSAEQQRQREEIDLYSITAKKSDLEVQKYRIKLENEAAVNEEKELVNQKLKTEINSCLQEMENLINVNKQLTDQLGMIKYEHANEIDSYAQIMKEAEDQHKAELLNIAEENAEQVKQIQNELQNEAEMLKIASDDLQKLRMKLGQKQAESDSLTAECENFEKQLATMQHELQKLTPFRQRCEDLEVENLQLLNSQQQLHAELSAAKTLVSQRDSAVKISKQKLDAATHNLDEANSALQQLRQQSAELSEENELLKQQMQQFTEHLQIIKADFEKQQEKADLLEANLKNSSSINVDDLKQENAAQHVKIAEYENTLKELGQVSMELAAENKSLRSKSMYQTEKLGESSLRNSELQKSLASEPNLTEVTQLKQTVERLQAQLQKGEVKEQKQFKEQLNKKDLQCKMLENEVENLKEELQQTNELLAVYRMQNVLEREE